jgi:hypothetical protein
MTDLTPEQQERFKRFNPSQPLIINASEIKGLDHILGRFVFKRPTIKDNIEIAVKQSKLTSNTDLAEVYNNLVYIIAKLSVVCIETPNGFVFEDQFDFAPILELYNRHEEWEGFFRLPVSAGQDRLSEKQLA